MNFEDWLLSTGKPASMSRKYARAISGVMSRWASEAGLVKQSLYEIETVAAFESACRDIRRLGVFEARNTIGKGMYSAALHAYTEYLIDIKREHLHVDIR